MILLRLYILYLKVIMKSLIITIFPIRLGLYSITKIYIRIGRQEQAVRKVQVEVREPSPICSIEFTHVIFEEHCQLQNSTYSI